MPDKTIHLVLGSGGARCLSYIGAIRELQVRGYSLASISACSAGTVVAALICAGLTPDRIEELVLNIDFKRLARNSGTIGPLSLFRLLKWPFAVQRESPLPGLVREFLGGDPRLRDLKIPFATLGVDIVSNTFVVYSSSSTGEMTVTSAIAIATALPGAFPPHVESGRIVVDAAIATTCPIWLTALQEQRVPILALTCSSERDVERPTGFFNYVTRIIDAGAQCGDQTLLALIPRLHHIPINGPRIAAGDFKLSNEAKRGLIDAGARAIREAGLDAQLAVLEGPPMANATHDPATGHGAAAVINNFYQKEVYMSTNQISTGGSANINIDSTLTNVTQTIANSGSLAAPQKDELKSLVAAFEAELEKIAQTHAAETALIRSRLSETVAAATRPAEQRSKPVLEITSKGLTEAASTVGKILPGLLTSAGLIAKFVVGL